MELKNFRIETKRLIIRSYIPEDAEAVHRVIGRKEIYDMTLLIPHPYPRENVDWWIEFTRKNIQCDYCYELGIFNQSTMQYVGNVGVFNISKHNHSGEVTYFVDPDQWQSGYATEAVLAILQFAFDKLQLERILGRCMACNTASKRVMEKCGLSFEGLARHEIQKDGKYIDVMHYAILSGEYYEQQEIIERKSY